ncbi:MAG: hypothetical protein WAO00_17735, partial [Chthoniobacterales bacterium]
YVALGFGVGLSLAAPGAKLEKGLRSLALPQFPSLVIAVLWQKDLRPSIQAFLEEIQKRAAAVAGRFPN